MTFSHCLIEDEWYSHLFLGKDNVSGQGNIVTDTKNTEG